MSKNHLVGYELDDDTAVERRRSGRYHGRLTDRWDVGGGMNGGYLAAFCLSGALQESELPDPLAMNVHYLSRPEPGEADLAVETLRAGRGHASLRFELSQATEIRCAGLLLCGRLRQGGRHDFQPPPPEVPPPEHCTPVRRAGEMVVRLWDRLETRVTSPESLFSLRSSPGEPTTGGWTRLSDGRPTDALAVALFLDSWPPAVLSRTLEMDPGGAPTLEYTVHWRGRPVSDWQFASLHTRTLAGGYADEHGSLYDLSGRLVAESRQLARYSAPATRRAVREG